MPYIISSRSVTDGISLSVSKSKVVYSSFISVDNELTLISSLIYPKTQRRQFIINVLHSSCARPPRWSAETGEWVNSWQVWDTGACYLRVVVDELTETGRHHWQQTSQQRRATQRQPHSIFIYTHTDQSHTHSLSTCRHTRRPPDILLTTTRGSAATTTTTTPV